MGRVVWFVVAPLAVVALVLLAVAGWLGLRDLDGTFSTSNLSAGFCEFNEQIEARQREAINTAATEFVAQFARSPRNARQRMSQRGKAATMDGVPFEAVQRRYAAMQTIGSPVVAETYFLSFLAGSEQGLLVPCDFRDGRAAFVGRGGTRKSAVVLITEDLTGLSQRTTSVWLEHEGGEWRVRALVYGPTALAGKNSEQLWSAAREHRARGNTFNASMLYAAARSALLTSNFFEARIAQDFQADLNSFEAHELVRGQAPFQWNFDGQTYRVQQANYMGFANGDVAFVIEHVAPWADHAEADRINRRLIDAFRERNPEWREVFDAVAARAHRPNSTERWGTVYTHKGYTSPPPGAQAGASETVGSEGDL